MRRCFLAALIVLTAGLLPAFAQNQPAIVFDTEMKDLGRVPDGEDLKLVFRFSNKGKGQLEILNVQPG